MDNLMGQYGEYYDALREGERVLCDQSGLEELTAKGHCHYCGSVNHTPISEPAAKVDRAGGQ